MANICSNYLIVSGGDYLAKSMDKAISILKDFGWNQVKPYVEDDKIIFAFIESKYTPFTRVCEDDDDGLLICNAFIDAGLSFMNYYEELGFNEYGCHIVNQNENIEVSLTSEEIELCKNSSSWFDRMDKMLNEKIEKRNNN